MDQVGRSREDITAHAHQTHFSFAQRPRTLCLWALSHNLATSHIGRKNKIASECAKTSLHGGFATHELDDTVLTQKQKAA